MNWPQFFKRFLNNFLLSVAAGVILLGLGGLLLAGTTGLINGLGWGALVGALAGLTIGTLFALQPAYWEDVAGRFSGWWVKHKEAEPDADPEREVDKK